MIVEFRRITKESTRDADRFLGRFAMPAVPDKGEIVNINGDPYRVIERGWAVTTTDPETYVYMRVK